MEKPLLMIPGPCALEREVCEAMSWQPVPHYGREWVEEFNRVRESLKPLFGTTEGKIYITVGSGHAGIEAGINAIAAEGDRLLVVNNGFFGERIVWIARNYGIEVVELRSEWGEPVDPEAVRDALDRDPMIKALAVVHGETSTGVLNPIKEIGKIACEREVLLFVDAICSVGGTEFLMDEWGVDLCVAASQKGLSAPAGLVILAVRQKVWDNLKKRKKRPVGWYLNVEVWRHFEESQGDFQPYGITMAVNNVRALQVSLDQMYREGLENRFRRHHEISRYIRDGLASLGLELFARGEPLPLVTVSKCPQGIEAEKLVTLLRKRYDIYITGGLGPYKEKTFRVGHMGPLAVPEVADYFLAALKDCLQQL
ncbi:aspartate aminotransferase [Thermanaeromonas toyohensis ToBE]|uniref:Aspartate aminotransferase n=1 Tax=Thermanaeromonas toyohensis ToBE TaxID=698762 RepID=A0A1W1VPA2_9FIRM|nr:alanine--glyoxylate aminotransferase family protein [Thermanaeromonas toyohensis]SMB95202.1 aspartate aminotransferase [Thermanaeromonas toyohensis ToBE]